MYNDNEKIFIDWEGYSQYSEEQIALLRKMANSNLREVLSSKDLSGENPEKNEWESWTIENPAL